MYCVVAELLSTEFLKPQFLETRDNSNQKSFSFLSQTLSFILDFSSKFSFLLEVSTL